MCREGGKCCGKERGREGGVKGGRSVEGRRDGNVKKGRKMRREELLPSAS